MAKSQFGKWLDKSFNIGHAMRDDRGFGAVLNKVKKIFDENLDDLIKKTTDSGMTTGEKERMDKQLANQQILNEDEYQRKIEFYEDYESPEAQVRQYKSAGLNPALMFGNGASVSASGGIGSPGSAGSASPSGGAGLFDVLQGILNIGKLNIEKKLAEADILKKETETSANRIENKYLEEANKKKLQALDQEIALKKSQESVNLQTLEKLSYDTDFARIYAAYAPDLFDMQLEQGYSNAALNDANAELSKADAELSRSRKREVESIVSKNDAEAEVFRKQLGLVAAQIRNLGTLSDLNEQSKKESIQRVKNLVEEAKLLGKKIGLTEKEIDWYAANHTEVVDVDDKGPVQKVTFKDNKGTYTVAGDGKVIYNRPYKTNVNAKGKRTN